MHKERKETTHEKIGEHDNNIIKYISRINAMFAITKWSKDQCTRDNVSKKEEKKRYINPYYIPYI